MSRPTFENWKANWEFGFTPEALTGVVTTHIAPLNRTFVCVQMLSKGMMKVWFDLLKQNHSRAITDSQLGTRMAGPCTLYMCFLTSNHTDIRDPTAISSAVPMYVNSPYLCFQGLMNLKRTFSGADTLNANKECLSLLILSAQKAPRKENAPLQLMFISPTPWVGNELKNRCSTTGMLFNKCAAGTLNSAHFCHTRSKNPCTCKLSIGNWKEAGIVKDYHLDELRVILPALKFVGQELGLINLPWATGYSFDIITQSGWVEEDETVAALTKKWRDSTQIMRFQVSSVSFLTILAGIDGIHTIEVKDFIKLDPLEGHAEMDKGV